MFYISSLFREKKKVVDGKVGTRILHLAVWVDPQGKTREKRVSVNFLCKHPEFSKWILKDKQKATLGIESFHHHQNKIRDVYSF